MQSRARVQTKKPVCKKITHRQHCQSVLLSCFLLGRDAFGHQLEHRVDNIVQVLCILVGPALEQPQNSPHVITHDELYLWTAALGVKALFIDDLFKDILDGLGHQLLKFPAIGSTFYAAQVCLLYTSHGLAGAGGAHQ